MTLRTASPVLVWTVLETAGAVKTMISATRSSVRGLPDAPQGVVGTDDIGFGHAVRRDVRHVAIQPRQLPGPASEAPRAARGLDEAWSPG